MIKKSIITALFLFVLYSLLIFVVAPNKGVSQHQFQENIIKAEHYLFSDSIQKNVIIGSSLSCRLIMDSLPEFYNLSFKGKGIFDGLNVIQQKEVIPETVFIEMNIPLRNADKELLSSLNNPFLRTGKRLLLSLREDKQPLAAIGHLVNGKVVLPAVKLMKANMNEGPGGKANQGLFNQLLKAQIENYNKVPKQKELEEAFIKLQSNVRILQEKGVRVVFFEVPVNKQLCSLPLAEIIRKEFLKRFPNNKYDYVPVPDCGYYKTSDGVHLTPDEAARYTAYFYSIAKKQLKR
jgi:hypothetical protein